MSFDAKITIKKGLYMLGKIVIAGVLSLISTGEFNTPLMLALVPLLEMGQNWLKHRNDE